MLVSSARERILATASQLFYAEGVRAVGVEDILERAGAAKASFYKHFRSKDELIVQFIKRRDEEWRDWLRAFVEQLSPEPNGRPLAVFDALEQRFARADFRGCAFTNCIFEVPDREHPAHVAAAEHKNHVTAYLEELLRGAQVPDPASLAREFMMLVDGAVVTAVREGSIWPARTARRVASALLAEARSQISLDGGITSAEPTSSEDSSS